MLKCARRTTVSTLAVVTCGLVGIAGVSHAGDGDLDDSFGIDGLGIVTPWEGGALHGNVMAVQPDDKIIVAGSESDAGEPDSSIMLVRFNADGSLDTGFGDGGVSILEAPTASDSVQGIAVDDSGAIIVVGLYIPDVKDAPENGFVVRFLPNGSPDSSFGDNGRVTLDLDDERTSLSDVVIQPDGKVLVAGGGDVAGWIVARYDVDGSPDTTFGNEGIIRVPDVGVPYGWAAPLVLQPDGRIVVAGGAPYSLAIARFEPDGSLDPTFDGDGIATTAELQDPTLSYTYSPKSVAVQPDGKVIVGGWMMEEYSAPLPFVWRFESDGSADIAFPEEGWYPRSGLLIVRPIDWDVAEYVAEMLLRPDGKIVLAGSTLGYKPDVLPLSQRLFVRRLDPNGIPDPTFGDNGLVLLGGEEPKPDSFAVEQVSGVVAQSNGKLVVDCSCRGDVPGPGIVLFRLGTVAGLVPELTTPASNAGGVTLRVANFNPDYTWSVESTAGAAAIDSSGAVSVTGLSSGESVTITVSASRPGYEAASASTTGAALVATLPETGTISFIIALAAVAFVAVGGAMLTTAHCRDIQRSTTGTAKAGPQVKAR